MDGKAQHFETLKHNLKQQVHLHKELLDVVRKEKEALVSANTDAIKELTFVKEAMVFEIQNVENNRKKWLQSFREEFSLQEDSLSLERVVEIIGQSYREELFRLKTSILTLANRIKGLSKENQLLTEHALSEANHMKQNALGISSINQTYSSNGKVEDNGKNARLISKEA